jgi:hypothetical protein
VCVEALGTAHSDSKRIFSLRLDHLSSIVKCR